MRYIKYFLFLFIVGCAPKYSDLGWEYFYSQNFSRSADFFQKSFSKDSTDYDTIKGLGLSYLMLEDFKKSETFI